jgi:hypothetical protein
MIEKTIDQEEISNLQNERAVDLGDLQLAFVGGGIGDTILCHR